MKKNYKFKNLRNHLRFVSTATLFLTAFQLTVNGQATNLLNTRPTLKPVEDQIVRSTGDTRFIHLSGITAGNEENQSTNISVASIDNDLVEAIEVNQTSNGNAYIQYRLKKGSSGTAIITVTITDNGEPAASFIRNFSLTVQPVVENIPVNNKTADESLLFPEGKDIIVKAFPNPSSSHSVVRFSTRKAMRHVNVDIYTTTGIKLQNLYMGNTDAGRTYTLPLTSTRMNSGVYVVRLTTPTQTQNLQLVFAK